MICNKKINYIFEINTLLSSDNLPDYGCIVATKQRVYTSCMKPFLPVKNNVKITSKNKRIGKFVKTNL